MPIVFVVTFQDNINYSMNNLIRTIRGKKLEMQRSNMSNWKAHYLFCCVCVENTNDLTLEMLCCG